MYGRTRGLIGNALRRRARPSRPRCSARPCGWSSSSRPTSRPWSTRPGSSARSPARRGPPSEPFGARPRAFVPDRMIVPVSDPDVSSARVDRRQDYCRSGPRSRAGARSRATKWLRTQGSGRVLTVYFCTNGVGTLYRKIPVLPPNSASRGMDELDHSGGSFGRRLEDPPPGSRAGGGGGHASAPGRSLAIQRSRPRRPDVPRATPMSPEPPRSPRKTDRRSS